MRCCCEHTCACQHRVAWITGYRGWPTSRCCEHTHMVCCRKNAGLNPRTKRYPRCGQPSAAVSIDMCVSQKQFKVAPKDQRLQRIGRPTAAVSIHMCVAEYINSGLHLSVKGYNGLADQLLLREHTSCVLQQKSTQDWFGRARPVGRTHVCCKISHLKVAPKDQGYNYYTGLTDQGLLRQYTRVSQNK